MRLVASGLPLGQFGYFLNSEMQGSSTPPASQGVLCLAGQIGRYNGSILNSGNTGQFELQLDLPTTPTPTGTTSIVAGPPAGGPSM